MQKVVLFSLERIRFGAKNCETLVKRFFSWKLSLICKGFAFKFQIKFQSNHYKRNWDNRGAGQKGLGLAIFKAVLTSRRRHHLTLSLLVVVIIKHSHWTRAVHATTLPRQRDNFFRPKLVGYYLMSLFGTATAFRHRGLTIVCSITLSLCHCRKAKKIVECPALVISRHCRRRDLPDPGGATSSLAW